MWSILHEAIMMKIQKTLMILFAFFIIAAIVVAIDFIPSGDVEGRGIYKIKNFTDVNITGNFYQNNRLVLDDSYDSLSNFSDDLGDRGFDRLTNFTDDLGDRGYTDLSNFTNDLGLTHLTNFTDNLGNRGYTDLSNFTNDVGFISNSFSSDVDANAYSLLNASNVTFSNDLNHRIYDNETCIIIVGDTSEVRIC